MTGMTTTTIDRTSSAAPGEARDRARRGSARWRRGAASLEAVLVAPVLIIVFAAVLFMLKLHSTKLEMMAEARRQAWTFSARACEGAPSRANTPGPEQATVEATRRRLEPGQGEHGRKTTDAVHDIIDDPLSGLFGESVRTETSEVILEPWLLGGREIRVTASYHLACNLAPKDLGDVAAEIWDAVGP